MAATSAALAVCEGAPGRDMLACWTNSRAAPQADTSSIWTPRGAPAAAAPAAPPHRQVQRPSGGRQHNQGWGRLASSPATHAGAVQLLKVAPAPAMPGGCPGESGHRVGAGLVADHVQAVENYLPHHPGIADGRQCDKEHPVREVSGIQRRSGASDSRVLPTPPVPVSVTSRILVVRMRTCAYDPPRSRSRPDQRRGQRHRRAWSARPGLSATGTPIAASPAATSW